VVVDAGSRQVLSALGTLSSKLVDTRETAPAMLTSPILAVVCPSTCNCVERGETTEQTAAFLT